MLKYPDIFDDWYVRYKPDPGICIDSWMICGGEAKAEMRYGMEKKMPLCEVEVYGINT